MIIINLRQKSYDKIHKNEEFKLWKMKQQKKNEKKI